MQIAISKDADGSILVVLGRWDSLEEAQRWCDETDEYPGTTVLELIPIADMSCLENLPTEEADMRRLGEVLWALTGYKEINFAIHDLLTFMFRKGMEYEQPARKKSSCWISGAITHIRGEGLGSLKCRAPFLQPARRHVRLLITCDRTP